MMFMQKVLQNVCLPKNDTGLLVEGKLAQYYILYILEWSLEFNFTNLSGCDHTFAEPCRSALVILNSVRVLKSCTIRTQ